VTSREELRRLDAADVLATVREMFALNDEEIYPRRNSLGPVSRTVRAARQRGHREPVGRGAGAKLGP